MNCMKCGEEIFPQKISRRLQRTWLKYFPDAPKRLFYSEVEDENAVRYATDGEVTCAETDEWHEPNPLEELMQDA